MYRVLWGLVLALLVAGGPAYAQKRVALVLGNSKYTAIAELSNPVNDATAIGALLRDQLHFQVVKAVDADLGQMMQALGDFGNKAKDADIALVFYAGHGIQLNGQNYLLPVTADIRTEMDLRTQAVRLNDIAEILDASGAKAKLLFIDACRNNPLPAISRGAEALGLAQQEVAVIGTLFAFATAPGHVAYDGVGVNSPFTAGLLLNLASPGVEIRQVLASVRDEVYKRTDKKQVPWVNEALLGQVFLADQVVMSAGLADAPTWNQADIAACAQIGSTSAPLLLESYLAHFPNGFCADAVREKLGGKPEAVVADSRALAIETPEQAAAATAPGQTFEVSNYWNHNGSVIALSASGENRVFYYERPKPLLARAGARKGTLLFKGRRTGDSYTGRAYHFSRFCGPISYPVTGEVSADQMQVVLTGRAPVRSPDCKQTGWEDEKLVFSFRSKKRS
ncbi:caspase family protein [Mesorhizobium sp. B2-3-4]|uniref:caspase family protein n=1 Tax=Mesorhizobium sp. B2-3-4 TaxID=2589959 RepID=UPI001125C12A|nr:caspase family protein [Mesorhizobium sp. B2-3-4]TPM35640.1 caspase family protein [Mesorhizobium sp. B2-3-4]